MTATVLLIRHASHDRLGRILCGRMDGVTLSRAGSNEAEALATALASRDIVEALYVSPLVRAQQTAEPIARTFGLTAATDPDLDEIDVGDWSGRSFDNLASDPAWRRWNLDRDRTRPPGGETMAEAQGRIVRMLERVSRRHPGGTVAFVSHADMIKAALAWGLGLGLAFYARFEVSPASVSRLRLESDGAQVLSLNERLAA